MNFVHLRGYFGCYCCGKLQTFWGEKWTTESMEMEKGLTVAFQWKTRIIVITKSKLPLLTSIIAVFSWILILGFEGFSKRQACRAVLNNPRQKEAWANEPENS